MCNGRVHIKVWDSCCLTPLCRRLPSPAVPMASSSSMRSLCAAAVAIALFVGVASAASAAVSPMAIGFEDLPWRFNASNVPLHVTGSIPSWVDGHLYRVGPVRYSLGPGKPSIAHWFNGLGMLHSFHVSDGQIQYTASYVPSTQYNSTVPGGDPISNNGPTSANTCVTVRKDAGHLLANTGASLSNEFLPDGTWQELPFQYGAPLQPVAETFAPSHSQTAPSGELFHYRVLFGQGGMQGYQLYTVGTDDGNATRVPLAFIKPNPAVGKPLYQHALSLTENYVVLIEMPCTFGNGWKNFEWIPEVGTLWHIVRWVCQSRVRHVDCRAGSLLTCVAACGCVVVCVCVCVCVCLCVSMILPAGRRGRRWRL